MDYFQRGRLSLSDEVYNAIFLKIAENQWKEGEKIPSETQLCKMYGVSRVSVRAALQKLQGQGLIATTQGIGSFVHKRNDVEKPASILVGDAFREFFEFRQAIEFKAIEFFVRYMQPQDEETLHNLIDQMRRCARAEERELFTDYDLAFHIAIVRGSRNRFFIEVMQQYQREFRQYLYEMAKQSPKSLAVVAEEHQEIYDLIVAKKVKAVQRYLYDNNMYYQVVFFNK